MAALLITKTIQDEYSRYIPLCPINNTPRLTYYIKVTNPDGT